MPFHVPLTIVPRVVILVEPAQVLRLVFSTLLRPTSLLVSERAVLRLAIVSHTGAPEPLDFNQYPLVPALVGA